MNRKLLIVSPHFPPVNAPDMQRVRTSLPYFREFGWDPYVVAVAPTGTEVVDSLLNETVPADVPIERVRSIPARVSRAFGVGNPAIRAMPFLMNAGGRLIAERGIDLVYFSTTMFTAMPLGRVWRRRFGTPYVLDIQDPWVTDYYDTHPESTPPPKYAIARRLHAVLEPWTMRAVGGVIAVSPAYIEALQNRYPWLSDAMCTVLPFGISTLDFQLLETHPQPNPCFKPAAGEWHAVFTGACGDFMRTALRNLFRAFRDGLAASPQLFERVRLHFVGTSYAEDARARKTVEPIASSLGVERFVEEQTHRVPYFQALQLVKDSDCLMVIGSDDPAYMASKLYSYVFAQKPILAIVHEQSVMNAPPLQAGAIVSTFGPRVDDQSAAADLMYRWARLLETPAAPPLGLPSSIAVHSARETTRRQCAAFDSVMTRARSLGSFVPCTN
jgi:hypothetical protein